MREPRNHGGSRPKVRQGDKRGGKRKGAGRKPVLKWKATRIHFGGHVIIEREKLGDLPPLPEAWELVDAQDGYIEFQRTIDGNSEIMTISEINFWNNSQ